MKKKLFMVLLCICCLFIQANANNMQSVQQKDFENKIVAIDLDGYKILEFSKRIKKIQFDSSDFIEADFLSKGEYPPLTRLKIKAKKIGKQNAIVTFEDDTMVTVGFNIVRNINEIIELIGKLYPDIKVTQMNDNIILQGYVENQTQKSKLIEIFEKSGIDVGVQIIDLIQDNHSTKMVRVKVYVVQIDNDRGEKLINEWNINGIPSESLLNGQTRVESLEISPNITSLAGGITAIANRAGSLFDIGLTLNYLKKYNAARIVNESTLIMKENQESKFNTGGKFFINTETTTAEGVPSSELTEVEYGLNISMKAKKIIENKYIDFEAMAKSDELDWDSAVDGIPGLKGNEVTTNVLVENGSTIVLAGILKIDNSQYKEKVPGLGDIPLLGSLFKSTDTKGERNDLVFFMTPEIVDPVEHDEVKILNQKMDIVERKDYRSNDEINEENLLKKEEQSSTSQEEKPLEKEETPKEKKTLLDYLTN